MSNKAFSSKMNKDFIGRIVGAVSEETEKVGESITRQVLGDESEQPSPIAQAMQQKTEEGEIQKRNTVTKQRKFIQTREELNRQLEEIKKHNSEKIKNWSEEVDRQFKIVDPGQGMEEKPSIPLTSKPKRGMMKGKPGTAKGETGPEVRKSQQ